MLDLACNWIRSEATHYSALAGAPL